MSFGGYQYIHKLDPAKPDAWFSFTCGHCNRPVSGAVAAVMVYGGESIKWLQCTNPECGKGSVLHINGTIIPGVMFGPNVQGLPTEVAAAYSEARRCMSVNAFTAAELLSRKILMHIAVDKGAKEGENFEPYISFLEAKGYVTPPMKFWVDLIRKHGNKSTHRLDPPEKDRAESTVMFTAELLRLVYEMEEMAKKYGPSPKQPAQ